MTLTWRTPYCAERRAYASTGRLVGTIRRDPFVILGDWSAKLAWATPHVQLGVFATEESAMEAVHRAADRIERDEPDVRLTFTGHGQEGSSLYLEPRNQEGIELLDRMVSALPDKATLRRPNMSKAIWLVWGPRAD